MFSLSQPSGYAIKTLICRADESCYRAFISDIVGCCGVPNPYLAKIALTTENTVIVSARTARDLGLKESQPVRLESAANPEGIVELGDGRTLTVSGKLKTVEGFLPGVVAVSWHYGHWAYESNDVEVDGIRVRGHRRRAAGLCPNMVMGVAPVMKEIALTDPIGASASLFDTHVRLELIA